MEREGKWERDAVGRGRRGFLFNSFRFLLPLDLPPPYQPTFWCRRTMFRPKVCTASRSDLRAASVGADGGTCRGARLVRLAVASVQPTLHPKCSTYGKHTCVYAVWPVGLVQPASHEDGLVIQGGAGDVVAVLRACVRGDSVSATCDFLSPFHPRLAHRRILLPRTLPSPKVRSPK